MIEYVLINRIVKVKIHNPNLHNFGKIPIIRIYTMKYTKYFSGIINEYGAPNLTEEQFRKFMNIVHLEGKLEGIDTIRRILKDAKEEHRFDLEYFNVNKKLTDLTGNLPPKELKEKLFK